MSIVMFCKMYVYMCRWVMWWKKERTNESKQKVNMNGDGGRRKQRQREWLRYCIHNNNEYQSNGIKQTLKLDGSVHELQFNFYAFSPRAHDRARARVCVCLFRQLHKAKSKQVNIWIFGLITSECSTYMLWHGILKLLIRFRFDMHYTHTHTTLALTGGTSTILITTSV